MNRLFRQIVLALLPMLFVAAVAVRTDAQSISAASIANAVLVSESGRSVRLSDLRGKVVFVNTDSVARSVVSEQGAPQSFNSGPIQPGKSWSFTFTKAGNYQFADGTRPYATGEVQVH